MYKYTNGAANNKLSNLSKIPPCPGIIFPLSFTFACLLNLDSTKSPIVPITETITLITSQFNIEKSKLNLLIIIAAKREKTKPPKKPSIVFLGETDGNNLFFPKFLPTKKANESFTQIIDSIHIIKLG